MASAIGTAVHNSVEDLCNIDLSSRDGDEIGWLIFVSSLDSPINDMALFEISKPPS